MGFPRRLLADEEDLVLVLRRHVVKALFLPLLVLVLTVAPAVALALVLPDGGARLWTLSALAVAAGVVVLRWTVRPFLRWRGEVYAVTNRRLIMRSGVLHRQGHDVPLSRINDVSFEHSLWERVLGCGTLVVESAGERGQLLLDDIPRVESVQRRLFELADEVREVVEEDEFDEDYRPPPRYRRR